ncbi:MAG: caspase family protein [Pseudomonadota bacterium]
MYAHSNLCRLALYTFCLLGLIIQGCQEPPVVPDRSVSTTPPTAQTTQHALVVGINQYQYADGNRLINLAGAVNDAELLKDALRRQKVQLPDERVLLNAQATRVAFIQAWRDMVKQAKPGDTLILTFAGHGGQQADVAPLDEKDGNDESIMFHDFNPNQPTQGRILDDELYGIFEELSDDNINILFIADSCHSSGMVRSIARPLGQVRTGGFWNIQPDDPPASPALPTQSDFFDGGKPPAHVTLITGVASDNLQVPETILDDKPHGALSWFLAQALNGKADGNQNGRLERDELETFLKEKVSVHTGQRQKPKLLPGGDTKAVFNLRKAPKPLPPAPQPDIAIVVQKGTAPQGLKHVRLVNASQSYDLLFVVNPQQSAVFNNTGDKITQLPSDALVRWQRVVNKERLLKVLETQFDMRLKPIRISLAEGDGLHKKGEVLHFSIKPGDRAEGLKALTLFNLAGNGELQFMYPYSEYNDPLVVQQFPYTPPAMKVAPPFGGDDLVAVLCTQAATGLHTLLVESQPNIPEPGQIISLLRNNRCQVGQYAFFSGGGSK